MNSVPTSGQIWDKQGLYFMTLGDWKRDFCFETVIRAMAGKYLPRSALLGELE